MAKTTPNTSTSEQQSWSTWDLIRFYLLTAAIGTKRLLGPIQLVMLFLTYAAYAKANSDMVSCETVDDHNGIGPYNDYGSSCGTAFQGTLNGVPYFLGLYAGVELYENLTNTRPFQQAVQVGGTALMALQPTLTQIPLSSFREVYKNFQIFFTEPVFDRFQALSPINFTAHYHYADTSIYTS